LTEARYFYYLSILFKEPDLTGGGIIKAEDRPAEGGFATSAFANQPQDFVLAESQIYPVHGLDVADYSLQETPVDREILLETFHFKDDAICIHIYILFPHKLNGAGMPLSLIDKVITPIHFSLFYDCARG
jgi:hypothetical protein